MADALALIKRPRRTRPHRRPPSAGFSAQWRPRRSRLIQQFMTSLVDTATIERVWQVVAGERRAAETVGGHRVTRSKGRLSFSVTSTMDKPAPDAAKLLGY